MIMPLDPIHTRNVDEEVFQTRFPLLSPPRPRLRPGPLGGRLLRSNLGLPPLAPPRESPLEPPPPSWDD